MSLTIIFNGPSTAQVVSPSSISSSEAFGTAVIIPGSVTVSPTSILSNEAFGTATITPGAVTIFPVGIDSGEAFGQARMMWRQIIAPDGLVTLERIGTPFVSQSFPLVNRPTYYIARTGRSVRRYTR